MEYFLYALGTLAYNVFVLWLAMIGVIAVFDICVSKLRHRRNRRRLNSLSDWSVTAAALTLFALAAGTVDHYILAPALDGGINFFFAS